MFVSSLVFDEVYIVKLETKSENSLLMLITTKLICCCFYRKQGDLAQQHIERDYQCCQT